MLRGGDVELVSVVPAQDARSTAGLVGAEVVDAVGEGVVGRTEAWAWG